ncbi:MAG: hypothetical protein OXG56_12040 [Gammaproteobacteria bacterium]|nr:hypothetical protein [Gammaproteobacteria bacterium]
MNSTLNYLENKFGPLMPLEGLAEILDRSPQGLRVSLHSSSPLSDSINATKCRLGRRIYFRTEAIAALIDSDDWEA